MAIQTLRNNSFASSLGSRLGEGLGTGLGSSLQQLAHNRLSQLSQRNALSETSRNLQQLGLSPAESTFVAQLPPKEQWDALRTFFQAGAGEELPQQALDPSQIPAQQEAPNQQQNINDLISLLSAPTPQQALGAQQVQSVQQPAQPPIALSQLPPKKQVTTPQVEIPVEKGKKTTLAQAVAKQPKEKKELSAAKQEHMDALRSQTENLEDLISTTERMLKSIDSGKVNVGIISTLKSAIAPTQLNETTELFDKDAAHVINLTSQNIKGVPSKFRVQLIQKEKPGVEHSINVNKQILQRLNKDAKRSLGSLSKQYPDLIDNPQEPQQSQKIFNDLPNASELKGKKLRDKETGKILQSNGNEWIEVK